jgi:hypothetical protein
MNGKSVAWRLHDVPTGEDKRGDGPVNDSSFEHRPGPPINIATDRTTAY